MPKRSCKNTNAARGKNPTPSYIFLGSDSNVKMIQAVKKLVKFTNLLILFEHVSRKKGND